MKSLFAIMFAVVLCSSLILKYRMAESYLLKYNHVKKVGAVEVLVYIAGF